MSSPDPSQTLALLRAVRDGQVSPDEAVRRLQIAPLQPTGEFATIDLHRRLRCGFSEVIYGEGKTPDQIVAILQTLREHGEGGLVTRVPEGAIEPLREHFPLGQWNELGRTFRIPSDDEADAPRLGKVVVVTAGTSDLPVAEEARVTAEAWHCEVHLISDVGVAGLHRLLNRLPEMVDADVIVAVAGMEAALPSVLGGLVSCPVIAVPTSVGYGVHFQGLTSMLGILNSCSSNVVAVNIDAGFRGGHVGGLIARRLGQARAESMTKG